MRHFQRLQLRYDQVIWKFHWEVSSAHAAKVAAGRLLSVMQDDGQ